MVNSPYAMILAAGFGSRLNPEEGHKLLAHVGGRPLIDYHLDNFARLGVHTTIVVTGHRSDDLEAPLEAVERPEAMDIVFAHNADYKRSNGLSVLAGVERLRACEDGGFAPFWLTMSDHLFEPAFFDDLASRFHAGRSSRWQGALGVDYKLDTIFDMPDATKVAVGTAPLRIGKELERFDAVDVGLFWCDRGFVAALEEERALRDDCSTSDAVRRLHEQDAFGFWDIGHRFWQDVDTPGAHEHAEVLLKGWKGRTH
ncbi:MAG: NTP transferase domain-containing protein [Bradymonadaceae bacterium]